MSRLTQRPRLRVLLVGLASVVLMTCGRGRQDAPGDEPAAAGEPVARTWNLQLVQLIESIDVDEAESGVLDGLAEAGFVEGRDYRKVVRNAQGDMPTVGGLIDAALKAGGELLITFSTPTLQAAMQRTQDVPIVFNYVADAVAAGAGTSDTDHEANVTGVYLVAAYDQMLPMIRQLSPDARVLGTVYVPAEANMVAQLEALRRAAADAGFEVRAGAAGTAAEVGDAAQALVANGVDVICQLPGNLTAQALPAIARAAREARLPMVGFQTSQVRAGAILALARDYYGSGREAGHLVARVMRGESPATIPLRGYTGTRLLVNLDAARDLGLEVPDALVTRADEVIGR